MLFTYNLRYEIRQDSIINLIISTDDIEWFQSLETITWKMLKDLEGWWITIHFVCFFLKHYSSKFKKKMCNNEH